MNLSAFAMHLGLLLCNNKKNSTERVYIALFLAGQHKQGRNIGVIRMPLVANAFFPSCSCSAVEDSHAEIPLTQAQPMSNDFLL